MLKKAEKTLFKHYITRVNEGQVEGKKGFMDQNEYEELLKNYS